MSKVPQSSIFACLFLALPGFLAAGPTQTDSSPWRLVYEENFDGVEEGRLPKDFFVLEGNFMVTDLNGRKCLSLKGIPVGEHGFLFGPRIRESNLELSFTCKGAVKSRRHSVFALALGGMSGIHQRFNPGTQSLLMSYGEDSHTRELIHWKSSEWVQVCLQVIQGNVHQEITIKTQWKNESEKTKMNEEIWRIEDAPLPNGKFILWGFSYAEKEMYWDDLKIRTQARRP